MEGRPQTILGAPRSTNLQGRRFVRTKYNVILSTDDVVSRLASILQNLFPPVFYFDRLRRILGEKTTITLVYDNDFISIINIYFYETFSTSNKHLALVLYSLDTLSDVRIKVFTLLF
jgi:hypothetical protein